MAKTTSGNAGKPMGSQPTAGSSGKNPGGSGPYKTGSPSKSGGVTGGRPA